MNTEDEIIVSIYVYLAVYFVPDNVLGDVDSKMKK